MSSESTMMGAMLVSTVLGVAACSSLDPNIGGWRTDTPSSEEAGVSVEGGADGDDTPGEGEVQFGRDIRPIMERPRENMDGKGCNGCHYRTAANHTGTDLSGLDLSTLGELRKGGGSSGPRIIVPGKPNESVLIQALRGQYAYSSRMPKGGPYWGTKEMDLVTKWIEQGAKGKPSE